MNNGRLILENETLSLSFQEFDASSMEICEMKNESRTVLTYVASKNQISCELVDEEVI